MKISEALSATYPGRGIIMGRSSKASGDKAVIAYFIMGRSENSRNRVFKQWGVQGRNLQTKAFDKSLVTDPSLIIYNPVKVLENRVIVTNGSQTDELITYMDRDQLTFEQALQSIEFEPDAPYYTPRISAIMSFYVHGQPGGSAAVPREALRYSLSIAKTADGNPDSCRRFIYDYYTPISGQGHFIHTYGDDDKNLPSFCGEPLTVDICDDIDTFTDTIWNSLNADNKVSLFTRYIDIRSGKFESRVVNKHE